MANLWVWGRRVAPSLVRRGGHIFVPTQQVASAQTTSPMALVHFRVLGPASLVEADASRLCELHAPFGFRNLLALKDAPHAWGELVRGSRSCTEAVAGMQAVGTAARHLSASLSAPRGSCAVVGSSSSLLGAGQGASIDAHAHVIRVNRAPAQPAVDVGSRTDLAVVHGTSAWTAYHRANGRSAAPSLGYAVYCMGEFGACIRYTHSQPAEARMSQVSPLMVDQLHGALIAEGQQSERYRLPSTGLVAIALARSLCNRTSIFGFDLSAPNESSGGSCARYYNCNANTSKYFSHDFERRVHDFPAQARLLSDWVASGAVQVGSRVRNEFSPKLATAAPPLDSMHAHTALGAQLSSLTSATLYPPSACIDGDLSTLCASGLEDNAWVSVQLDVGSRVDCVAVYNRDDGNPTFQAWLSPFEVYVGSSYGDLGYQCAAPMSVPVGAGPFLINCGGTTAGSYVTLRLAGPQPGGRYLSIAELKVFSAQGPPSLPPPPPVCGDLIVGLTDLAFVSASVGETAWCFHMDSTRPAWVSQFGACDTFFHSAAYGGLGGDERSIRYCYTDPSGDCKADDAYTPCDLGNVPPPPPPPPSLPPPPPPPPPPPSPVPLTPPPPKALSLVCLSDGSVVQRGVRLAATMPCDWGSAHSTPSPSPTGSPECRAASLIRSIQNRSVGRRELELVVSRYDEEIEWSEPLAHVRTVCKAMGMEPLRIREECRATPA